MQDLSAIGKECFGRSKGEFVMDRGNKKQEIQEAALELFSVQGFEATSISQIASAVGIRKASLYSHFENKQAILDALVQEVLEQYGKHSLFARTDWEKDAGSAPQTPDAAVQMIQGQIRYILHDPTISRARKMLVIEQFQNPELAKLQTKQNYSDVLGYFTGLMKQLIRQGVLAEDDPEIMAAQFCLPISVWLELCDREPDREQEVMELVEKHIRQFFRHYQPEVG
ncbi:MAG TPA: TetR/AcrR family transcriptional regulator [Ruminococcaceae bacterium]|nr:TetR/AcrR family transcriptional regulator [Oscillospiraceae bacterium]HCU32848.1 TetR/AcrR family transcriptional regulator [Oscillospiraceae bacterium]